MTTEGSSSPTISVADPLSWQHDVIGESLADTGFAAASNGDMTVVVTGAEDGVIRAWWSDGSDFALAEVAAGDHQGSPISEIAVTTHDGGFMAIASDWESYVRVWTSDDGQRWEPSPADGLKGPADVYASISTPDGMLVAGSLRTANESSQEDFVPVLWRSSDGRKWEQLTSPAGSKPRGGLVSELVVTEDSIIAVGRKARRVAFWRSTDGGDSWERSTIDGGESIDYHSVRSVARLDDALVGVGMVGDDLVGDPVVLRSDDDGRTWTVSPFENPVAPGLEVSVGTTAAGGGLWGSTGRYVDSWTDPDACYRDLVACQGGAGSVLLYSGDGKDWAEVDLESLGLPADLWLVDILDTTDGLLLVGGRDGKITA
ncbi:MAG: hypothetical protein GEU79_16490, partial [Acidimicrobiia bacterium]|nr:hypothetical protein [Acidimicrobiia bacterium]